MAQEELDERAGVAREKFAVGPAIQAGLRWLDRFLGGQALLARGGRATDAGEARQLRDLQAGAAVEQEGGEQARGVGLGAPALAEVKGSAQRTPLIGREAVFGDLRLSQPGGKGVRCGRQGNPSRTMTRKVVYSVTAKG